MLFLAIVFLAVYYLSLFILFLCGAMEQKFLKMLEIPCAQVVNATMERYESRFQLLDPITSGYRFVKEKIYPEVS
jgi:hypothetical protein